MCDLENVHLGNTMFDIGFFVGHIYVHGIDRDHPTNDFINSFLDGYGSNAITFDINDPLLKRIALGTCLYRLDNKIVPYQIDIPAETRKRHIDNIVIILDNATISWDDIVSSLRYE